MVDMVTRMPARLIRYRGFNGFPGEKEEDGPTTDGQNKEVGLTGQPNLREGGESSGLPGDPGFKGKAEYPGQNGLADGDRLLRISKTARTRRSFRICQEKEQSELPVFLGQPGQSVPEPVGSPVTPDLHEKDGFE
ncbi:hypothetical protein GCK72_022900 [Caenorhabditis remanei]|uniref:Uncharacterized protein n=1 Tax=Caenorhabditis remanei TaxID=31234 RepID=A0A6A5FV80_CAERE|nr:hypothetical protein GCK72_022900 [Caenorhabditis remanei]KAF1746444.1 hypothetical protein GCK72_022900 [Caenorhabditis remanei]